MAREDEATLLTQISEHNAWVCKVWDEADRTGEEPSADVVQQVKDRNKTIEELEHRVKDLRERSGLRAQAESRRREQETPVNGLGAGRVITKDDKAAASRIGDLILENPGFKSWRESIMIGGAVSSSQFGHSPRVPIPGGMKTLVTGLSDTSAGALIPVSEMYPTMVQGTYARPLVVRDLITTGTTTSDAIEYPLEGTPTNNAAVVAEATAASGSTGAKPESAIALSKATAVVKTIAHWIPATRQALADAGQLRMYIENFLRYGLNEKLEDQILAGDGVGDNFTGVLNTSGTTAQAYDTNLLTTTRRARTKVRVTGRAVPTAYVFHPNDWEDIDLTQDNEARYYFGGPSVLGNPRLWGLPVVESEGMTEGTGVVADWRRAVLLDREQVQILASDSHMDFFVRNLIALLAELRAAMFLIRPAAFVEMDLTP